MSAEAEAARRLRELREEPFTPRSSEDEAARMARHLAAMDAFVTRQSQRVTWAPRLAAAAAILLLLTAGGLGAMQVVQTNTVEPNATARLLAGSLSVEGGSNEHLSLPRALQRGVPLHQAPNSRSTLQLESGARMELSQAARITLEGTQVNEAVRLAQGRVDLAVPPLGTRRLSVLTPNAVVTVVGTRFSVSVDHETRSCVAVSEGRVAIDSHGQQLSLTPGESWSSDGRPCFEAAAIPPPTPAAPTASTPPIQRSSPRLPPSAGEERKSGSLAEQNRLFAAALRARDQGDLERARKYWSELVQRYPDATLAPPARRELEKLRTATENAH